MADIHGTREELVAVIVSKVAEIERLRAAIKDIADMQDDEWNEVKYHAMRDWAAQVLNQQRPPE